MVDITIYSYIINEVYQPAYNWGAPSCTEWVLKNYKQAYNWGHPCRTSWYGWASSLRSKPPHWVRKKTTTLESLLKQLNKIIFYSSIVSIAIFLINYWSSSIVSIIINPSFACFNSSIPIKPPIFSTPSSIQVHGPRLHNPSAAGKHPPEDLWPRPGRRNEGGPGQGRIRSLLIHKKAIKNSILHHLQHLQLCTDVL